MRVGFLLMTRETTWTSFSYIRQHSFSFFSVPASFLHSRQDSLGLHVHVYASSATVFDRIATTAFSRIRHCEISHMWVFSRGATTPYAHFFKVLCLIRNHCVKSWKFSASRVFPRECGVIKIHVGAGSVFQVVWENVCLAWTRLKVCYQIIKS